METLCIPNPFDTDFARIDSKEYIRIIGYTPAGLMPLREIEQVLTITKHKKIGAFRVLLEIMASQS